MDKAEIIESIRILNETINSNFLKINDIKIDMNIFKKMISEKKNKTKKYKYEKNEEQTNENMNFSPSSSSQKSQSSKSSTSSTDIIDDSIEVTNFAIPSSIYKSSNASTNASTNTQTAISNL
jgi:hypothetical protein